MFRWFQTRAAHIIRLICCALAIFISVLIFIPGRSYSWYVSQGSGAFRLSLDIRYPLGEDEEDCSHDDDTEDTVIMSEPILNEEDTEEAVIMTEPILNEEDELEEMEMDEVTE